MLAMQCCKQNSLFSPNLERSGFCICCLGRCNSEVFKVLYAVCPPPQVIRESLLEVLVFLIRRHTSLTEKKRITDKDRNIMKNVVKILNPFESATEQLSANAAQGEVCTLCK